MKEYIERDIGKWEIQRDDEISKSVKCSVCQTNFYYAKRGQLQIDKMEYCPKCGARMIIEE